MHVQHWLRWQCVCCVCSAGEHWEEIMHMYGACDLSSSMLSCQTNATVMVWTSTPQFKCMRLPQWTQNNECKLIAIIKRMQLSTCIHIILCVYLFKFTWHVGSSKTSGLKCAKSFSLWGGGVWGQNYIIQVGFMATVYFHTHSSAQPTY